MKLAIYITGSTYTDISNRYGDFEDWFALHVSRYGFETIPVDVRRGECADLEDVDGIMITGSSASVCTDPEPWIHTAIEHLQEILTFDFPVLGVCFGHQILAAAAGCTVERHPERRELGTVQLSQTPAGQTHPLFQDIPMQFAVQETHEDIVSAVPNTSNISILAGNDYNSFQALAYTDHIFSVQFHPEITADIIQAYIAIYGKELRRSGELSPADYEEIEQSVEETNTGELVFRNFCRIVRNKAGSEYS